MLERLKELLVEKYVRITDTLGPNTVEGVCVEIHHQGRDCYALIIEQTPKIQRPGRLMYEIDVKKVLHDCVEGLIPHKHAGRFVQFSSLPPIRRKLRELIEKYKDVQEYRNFDQALIYYRLKKLEYSSGDNVNADEISKALQSLASAALEARDDFVASLNS